MTRGWSRFVEDDAEVLRRALNSHDKLLALATLLKALGVARRIQIGSVDLPIASRWAVLEDLNELEITLLGNLQVELGVDDLPFGGVTGGLVDEILRPRQETDSIRQMREAVRFTAAKLRRREWVSGSGRRRCPRCGEGWVVYAGVRDPAAFSVAAIVVCESCEAAWLPESVLAPEGAIELSDIESKDAKSLDWDGLAVRGESAD